MSWASRRWERRAGLRSRAGHYSGGGRGVNTVSSVRSARSTVALAIC